MFVPWSIFSESLNRYFLTVVGTNERALSEQDLNACHRALKKCDPVCPPKYVSITAFQLFFPWFEEFSKVIHKIKDIWVVTNPQLVAGLISEVDANAWLHSRENGKKNKKI